MGNSPCCTVLVATVLEERAVTSGVTRESLAQDSSVEELDHLLELPISKYRSPEKQGCLEVQL